MGGIRGLIRPNKKRGVAKILLLDGGLVGARVRRHSAAQIGRSKTIVFLYARGAVVVVVVAVDQNNFPLC